MFFFFFVVDVVRALVGGALELGKSGGSRSVPVAEVSWGRAGVAVACPLPKCVVVARCAEQR
jgi:hypothetical protein